jgi:hypothetical protein
LLRHKSALYCAVSGFLERFFERTHNRKKKCPQHHTSQIQRTEQINSQFEVQTNNRNIPSVRKNKQKYFDARFCDCIGSVNSWISNNPKGSAFPRKQVERIPEWKYTENICFYLDPTSLFMRKLRAD